MKNMSPDEIKNEVKSKYGDVARGRKKSCCEPKSPCCGGSMGAETTSETDVNYASSPREIAKKLGYTDEELALLPSDANLGLGCGNPTAIASLKPGETVLDLGSGAGMDCFLAAAKVGTSGRVIGVDMTPEMIEKANRNLRKANFVNIEFRLGEIEDLPVDDNSVDIVISNCVLNLVPDKLQAFREIYRVLKPGGRIAVSDIVKLRKLPDAIENDTDSLSACISGALLFTDYLAAISDAGLRDIKVVSKEDFGEMFAATEGPVSEKMKKTFADGNPRGYIASIKVTAVKPNILKRGLSL